MEPDKIKDWLKEIGEDREWLANECGTSKTTVDGWLSAGRKIPAPTLKIIKRLATGDLSLNPDLPLETFRKAQELARKEGMTLDEWIGMLIEREVVQKG